MATSLAGAPEAVMQLAVSTLSPPTLSLPLTAGPAVGGLAPGLDPLHADQYFVQLPSWNQAADIVPIYQALCDMLPTSYRIATMTIPEAIASIRDLGMMSASLARHGANPTDVVPHLEECLLQLGDLVDMVPRDTVYHYGVWNPPGRRERRFTSAAAEGALIDAVRVAAPAIDATLEWLCAVVSMPLDSEEFVAGCRDAAQRLESILDAIGQVKKEIPPVFFAQTLRPYFAPLVLGGQTFNGASAAPLSMCILDHLLWSSDCRDRAFRQFQLKQIRYNMPHWRLLYARTLGRPSLVTRMVQAHASGELHNRETIEAVVDLLHVLIAFRGRHRFVAMRAYSAEVRKFEVGSGGYGVDTLEHILHLTRDASKTLNDLLGNSTESQAQT
jgi:hypothetical protein